MNNNQCNVCIKEIKEGEYYQKVTETKDSSKNFFFIKKGISKSYDTTMCKDCLKEDFKEELYGIKEEFLIVFYIIIAYFWYEVLKEEYSKLSLAIIITIILGIISSILLITWNKGNKEINEI